MLKSCRFSIILISSQTTMRQWVTAADNVCSALSHRRSSSPALCTKIDSLMQEIPTSILLWFWEKTRLRFCSKKSLQLTALTKWTIFMVLTCQGCSGKMPLKSCLSFLWIAVMICSTFVHRPAHHQWSCAAGLQSPVDCVCMDELITAANDKWSFQAVLGRDGSLTCLAGCTAVTWRTNTVCCKTLRKISCIISMYVYSYCSDTLRHCVTAVYTSVHQHLYAVILFFDPMAVADFLPWQYSEKPRFITWTQGFDHGRHPHSIP